jgi:hypothetical protein
MQEEQDTATIMFAQEFKKRCEIGAGMMKKAAEAAAIAQRQQQRQQRRPRAAVSPWGLSS